ncbi:MAG TPA: TAT-variant-translocated molybdopterin oxidoreductase, partial [Gemmataceae bacterium]|nr:TAT-variant-translocated molybdopterin oxidoreductase [Gemmataceae bacterium]
MNNRKDLSKELAAAQERLGQDRGPKYWRTLEELAQTPAFQEVMRLEFPEQADIWPDHLSRRKFLTLMGASLALAGVAGCSTRPAPSVELTPYVNAPEELVPGKPLFYATTMTMAGSAVGLLVEQHEGRPTKIEGNPDHPASGGATDIYNQASILTLYDPDRAPNVTILGKTTSWEAAFAFNESEGNTRTLNGQITLGQALYQQRQKKGSGLRILTETIVSPTLAAQLEQLLGDKGPYSQAKWHVYEPCHADNAVQGMMMAYGTRSNGRVPNSYHDFKKAEVVVSLDNDFLSCGPGKLNDVRGFMSKRRVRTNEPGQAKMNRLYVAESNVTTTGAKADHRLAIKAGLVESLARALAAQLGVEAAGKVSLEAAGSPEHRDAAERWVQAAAADLKA